MISSHSVYISTMPALPINIMFSINKVKLELSADFLAGFVLPFIVATTGLLAPVFFFEWAVRLPYFRKYQISYREGRARFKDVSYDPTPLSTAATHEEYTMNAFRRVPVVAFIASAILYSLKLEMFSARALSECPSVFNMIFQYMLYYFFSDFVAFLNHCLVHKNDFLWKHVHAMHHEVHTPTALSGPYSTYYDYLMFGGMPNIVAAAVIQPHALVFYLGVLTNTYGVAYLHSGLQHPCFDFLLSGCFLLPFHATSRLHDRHHRRAGRQAKDMGEHVWLWDYLAGTLSDGPV